MKSIVFRASRDYVVEDRPEPTPGRGEVLVRPLFVGLCFTDKHWYDGSYNPPGGMIGGHEFSAEVVELGPGVEGLEVGQRVSIDPRVYCGQCGPCRAGLPTMCDAGAKSIGVSAGYDGGLAELCKVPGYGCYALPDSVGALAAAFADPACCATRAIRHGGVRIGDNVVLFGGEDYNLFAVQWLRAAGANRIIVVDPSEMRRDAALEAGAHEALGVEGVDVAAAIRASMPTGADVVIVSFENYVVESARYMPLAIDVCRRQGRVIVMRAYNEKVYAELSPQAPWLKEISILHFGNFFGNEPMQGGRARGDWQLTLDAIGDGRLRAPLVGAEVIPFTDINDKSDVDAIFTGIPDRSVKTLIEVTVAR